MTPFWERKRRGISKTTTKRKQERGHPCSTPCVVVNTTSSAPRRKVAPRASTREVRSSSLAGVPILRRMVNEVYWGAVERMVYIEGQYDPFVGHVFEFLREGLGSVGGRRALAAVELFGS